MAEHQIAVPPGLEWFAALISDRLDRLEGVIENLRREIKDDFVMKHEVAGLKEDVDRVHAKQRELETRVHAFELREAANTGGDKVRWGVIAQVAGAVSVILLAIVMTWLGLK